MQQVSAQPPVMFPSMQPSPANGSESDTTDAQDWKEVYEAVRWIQLVMALLSVLGSSSVIIAVAIRRLGRTLELQPLLLLSLSDLLLALCWLVGATLFSQRCSNVNTLCYQLHTVEQILYMASFLFTLLYVWNLYVGIREKFYGCSGGCAPRVSEWVKAAGQIAALFSGLLPVLMMLPVFIQGNLSDCQANFSEPYRCLLMHTGALYLTPQDQPRVPACRWLHTYGLAVFLAMFLLTLLGIIVLMVSARRIYRRTVTSCGYLGSQQRATFRLMDRRMLLYPLVFFCCWGPAVALALVQVVEPSVAQGAAGVALYVSQAFTSASQGFLNCLVYGWTRLLRRGHAPSREADTQTPLLRAQKKKSSSSSSYQALSGAAG
ncbi:transmembrane protein 116-like [Nelusetta ayraudi]|uniref:transmembrane protein 116-like n=1 Tax=Nelusetta ayraudi TaxID=303726 RepID=UPI003F6FD4EF